MDREYVPELERAKKAREQSLQAAKEDSMSRLMKDLSVDRIRNPEAAASDRWASDADEDDDVDDEMNIIDRSRSSYLDIPH